MLSAAHAEGVRVLSMEPDVAAAAGLGIALSAEETRDYIAAATKAREQMQGYEERLVRAKDLFAVAFRTIFGEDIEEVKRTL